MQCWDSEKNSTPGLISAHLLFRLCGKSIIENVEASTVLRCIFTALTNYLELLALHKKHDLVINSYHIEGTENYTETFEYIRNVKSRQVIVDCRLSSIAGFLNKALEMQMLTNDYHYHFTSLVGTALHVRMQ